jgi:hypothetical protein
MLRGWCCGAELTASQIRTLHQASGAAEGDGRVFSHAARDCRLEHLPPHSGATVGAVREVCCPPGRDLRTVRGTTLLPLLIAGGDCRRVGASQ